MAILVNDRYSSGVGRGSQRAGTRQVTRYRGVEGEEETVDIIKMRPLFTVAGPSSSEEVLPPREEYICTAPMRSISVYVEALGISGANVYLETAAGAEGPWQALATFTQHTVTSVLLTGEGGGPTGGLQALLRWRLLSTGANWKACFWMEATPDLAQQRGSSRGGQASRDDDL
jgi:hypothetical protein